MIIDTPSRHFLSCPVSGLRCVRAQWMPQLALPPAPLLCLSMPCASARDLQSQHLLPSSLPAALPSFLVSAPQTLSPISPAQHEGGTLTSSFLPKATGRPFLEGYPSIVTRTQQRANKILHQQLGEDVFFKSSDACGSKPSCVFVQLVHEAPRSKEFLHSVF